MAQFDVYRNRGRQREVIPFVVAVQSSLYDDYSRRVVIPLVRASALGNVANARLNPIFKIKTSLSCCIRSRLFRCPSVSWVSRLHL